MEIEYYSLTRGLITLPWCFINYFFGLYNFIIIILNHGKAFYPYFYERIY